MRRRPTKDTPEYEIAIPTRDDIMSSLKDGGKPLNSKEIAANFDLFTEDERKAIRKRIKAMMRDGQIIRNRRGEYAPINKLDLISGVVMGHPDGFGFLVTDKAKDGEDVYLSNKVMRSLLHGDRAIVRAAGRNRRGKLEGSLVEVVERANDRVVGRYYKEKSIGFVVPDNKRLHQDVFIPKGQEKKAANGQYVVVKLTRQPDQHTQPVGKIVDIIGDSTDRGIATDVAIRAYDIPLEWPDDVQQAVRKLDPDKVEIPAGYTDLRNQPFVTIDGEDARDFDDAVYCRVDGDKWQLSVAIADVSHYVKPGSALDEEAYLRGTSVYFPDRVVPMLPEVLSNGLCSLKPEVDRLAMVCEMSIDSTGTVRDYRFKKAVIRSAARLTYDQVAAIVVDRDDGKRKKQQKVVPELENIYRLFKKMHEARQRLGVLDFDTTESRIIFGKEGKISTIEPVFRNDAHRLIEEFMLAANICAASYLSRKKVPALYRIHETPKAEKLEKLREFLKAFGLDLAGGDEPTARDYALVIDSIKGRPDARLIQTILLRSMPLAYYGEENLGHFGLAFEAYTHFTSPIRRYPDLVVHRAIKAVLDKTLDTYGFDNDRMHEYGVHCSVTERRAEEASRDVVQRLKCEYMEDRIGEVFEGTITSVTGFGLFVELNDVFVEGLVHVTSLPSDFYHHDAVHHSLRGERTGRTYRVAGQVKVRLVRVDTDENKIDFEIVGK